MNGIDRITAKIKADNDEACKAVIQQAKAQSAEIISAAEASAKQEYDASVALGKKEAELRRERLLNSSRSQSKKLLLASKQKMLDAAYSLALDKLCTMEGKAEFMAKLAAGASASGTEGLIMNSQDREQIGKAVTDMANSLLEKAGKPHSLTLSPETRAIRGGLYVSGGSIEANCTFEALVNAQREESAGLTAKVLFD